MNEGLPKMPDYREVSQSAFREMLRCHSDDWIRREAAKIRRRIKAGAYNPDSARLMAIRLKGMMIELETRRPGRNP